MTTVPPPTTPASTVVAAPATTPVVQIVEPPPAVAAAAPGTVLEAIVAATAAPTDAAGKPAVTLRTPAGDVTIRLPVQLPDNARVALEVLRSALPPTAANTPQVSVRIISIDGQPAAQVLAQLARQAVDIRGAGLPQAAPPPVLAEQNPLLKIAVLPPGTAWLPAGPQAITSLNTFSALVTAGLPITMTPTQQNVATPGNLPVMAANLPASPSQMFTPLAGSELSLRVVSIQLPSGAASVPLAPNTLALVPPPATAGAAVAVAAPIAAPTSGIVSGPDVTQPQPIAPQPATTPSPHPGLVLPGPQGLGTPPPSPPVAVQPLPPITTLSAMVIAVSPDGAPIVETEAGQIQLNVRANLPAGTRMVLEITAQLDPRPGLPAPAPPAALPLSIAAGTPVGWPTLAESLTLLQRVDPQTAQQLAQAIPDGGPRTAAALISFAQAMRSGDSRQWPGDITLRALERAGPRGAHLSSQLSEEVAALSSRARETATEWRTLPIPWNANGQIDRIALITRRENDGDGDGKKKAGGGGTRFLINLDLSRMGSMQLDGMFRKETRALDLMIRTKTALPDHIRLDLTGILAASNAAMGLKGGLTFQVVKKFADPIGQAGGWTADKSGLWA